MANYRIGVLPGDDIGLEIVPVAVSVLQAALQRFPGAAIDWVELPVGMPSYRRSGETCPPATLDALYGLDGWILGPIGHMAYPKDDPRAINPHPIIRRNYDLVSNIRPTRSYDSIPSLHQGVDVVIVRENNEGSGTPRKRSRRFTRTPSSSSAAACSSRPAPRWPRSIRTLPSKPGWSTPSR
jgi:3-isopropylmalate dehydrogenase